MRTPERLETLLGRRVVWGGYCGSPKRFGQVEAVFPGLVSLEHDGSEYKHAEPYALIRVEGDGYTSQRLLPVGEFQFTDEEPTYEDEDYDDEDEDDDWDDEDDE